MTYFPDLSEYTYLQQKNPMLHVGWLDPAATAAYSSDIIIDMTVGIVSERS